MLGNVNGDAQNLLLRPCIAPIVSCEAVLDHYCVRIDADSRRGVRKMCWRPPAGVERFAKQCIRAELCGHLFGYGASNNERLALGLWQMSTIRGLIAD